MKRLKDWPWGYELNEVSQQRLSDLILISYPNLEKQRDGINKILLYAYLNKETFLLSEKQLNCLERPKRAGTIFKEIMTLMRSEFITKM